MPFQRILSGRWVPVPIEAYRSLYSVSDQGLVKRNGSPPLVIGLQNGYPRVTLWVNGRGKHFYVHALVCLAFHGPSPGTIGKTPGTWQVDHIDRDPANNAAKNLRWLPFSTNRAQASVNKGDQHYAAKLLWDQVQAIREEYAADNRAGSQVMIANRYKVSPSAINQIVLGRTWWETSPRRSRGR